MSDIPCRTDDKFGRYLFEYRHEGAEWGIEIHANSPADAKERLKSMAWAQYQGEVFAKVPVPATGLIRRIAAWFQ